MTDKNVSSNLTGRAWGKPAPHYDEALVLSGPGTPGGELLRRYWQPVALTTDIEDRPVSVRIMGEDLVLYRAGNGDLGLLYSRCCHRGSSLLYGKVEEEGLRCCYHGWLFDPSGHCLETPCEPSSKTRERVRQPWYPVMERWGMVFAYMGPADKQPDFPRFSLLEDLAEDETLIAFERKCGPNSPHPKVAATTDYNWWQAYDNFLDPYHVPIMHHMINGAQFSDDLGIIPNVTFEYTADGVCSIQHRDLENGKIHQRISQVIMPNLHCTAGVSDEDLGRSNLGWIVPQDDTSYRHFVIVRVKKGQSHLRFLDHIGMMSDAWGPRHGRPFSEWSLEDHQRWQTDYTAQKSQGDISFHSEEHLGMTDQGIGMMRRMFRKLAQSVAAGDNPAGSEPGRSSFSSVVAGNALLDAKDGSLIDGFNGLGRTPVASK